MKTKEAIEFVDYLITIADERYNEDSIEKKNEILTLLKRGEKYKEMWKKCEEMWGQLTSRVFSQQSKDTDNVSYCDLLELKQKYFPKEK